MKSIAHLSCREANEIDLIDYLGSLGHQPQKISGSNYWYLSPLRQERTPSFKVDRGLNLWYDHGTGQGGTLIDLGIQYHRCTIRDLLNSLSTKNRPLLSFHPQPHSPANDRENNNRRSPIQIVNAETITAPPLISYLEERQIPLQIAREYCSQVDFQLYQKTRLAIGFKNDSARYELRSQDFKGSSSPKEPKLIGQTGAKTIAVFEGFFSFLSYKTLQKNSLPEKSILPIQQEDFLVLNSLAFFEKSRNKMEAYQTIKLFFDRDNAGMAATQKALQWSAKYKDSSKLFKQHKDLNEFLVNAINPRLKESRGRVIDFKFQEPAMFRCAPKLCFPHPAGAGFCR